MTETTTVTGLTDTPDPRGVDMPGADVADGSITVDRSWWSAVGVHGGYLAGLALGAMRARLAHDHPARSLTVHFLSPAGEAPISVQVAAHRDGAGSSVTSCTARQGGAEVLIGSALFGIARPGPDHDGVPMPRVVPPERCDPITLPAELATYSQYLELRPATAVLPLLAGAEPELVMWVRFADGHALDAERVVMFTDVLPPALFAIWDRPRPVPSADLTVHFGDALADGPVEGWALVRIRTAYAGSSWAVDDSTVWAADGRLLAVARQSRRVLPGRP
jgi:acyl-CoA thioesterase